MQDAEKVVVKILGELTAEAWLTICLAIIGIFGLAFLPHLVAAPKVLFGRSLTAISPSLFPSLVLGAMAVLSCLLLYSIRRSLRSEESREFEKGTLQRVVQLFAVMVFYALAMDPIGFLISSAISMAIISWIAGNRSFVQIAAVSIFFPIGLYLLATRGLAVSLPELSSIEFFYARLFDGFSAGPEGVSQ